MVLVRQPKTAGFRPKSRYDIHRLAYMFYGKKHPISNVLMKIDLPNLNFYHRPMCWLPEFNKVMSLKNSGEKQKWKINILILTDKSKLNFPFICSSLCKFKNLKKNFKFCSLSKMCVWL